MSKDQKEKIGTANKGKVRTLEQNLKNSERQKRKETRAL